MTVKNLLDHLQESGYMPDDDPLHDGWHDLIVSGIGSIRVCMDAFTGDDVAVHAFDKFKACEWSTRFSAGTPDAVIIGTLQAAEWQLAGKRGGPVTPAQEAGTR